MESVDARADRRAEGGDTVELKPCPFCGRQAEFMRYSMGSVGAGCIACAIMFFVSNGNENEAAKMWNRRANNG